MRSYSHWPLSFWAARELLTGQKKRKKDEIKGLYFEYELNSIISADKFQIETTSPGPMFAFYRDKSMFPCTWSHNQPAIRFVQLYQLTTNQRVILILFRVCSGFFLFVMPSDTLLFSIKSSNQEGIVFWNGSPTNPPLLPGCSRLLGSRSQGLYLFGRASFNLLDTSNAIIFHILYLFRDQLLVAVLWIRLPTVVTVIPVLLPLLNKLVFLL